MTGIGPALTTALVEFIWQGVVVAAALWIVLSLLRRPQARCLASTLAMALLACAPGITFLRGYSRPVSNGFVFAGAASLVAEIAGASVSSTLPVRNWVLDLWAFGVLLFSVRLVRSAAQVNRMRRAGEPAESAIVSMAAAVAGRMGLKCAVHVLVSTMSEVPSVIGWLRPAILLPASALTGLTPDQLETVIAHELAHIRRHDYAINLLQVLMETLLFYHPAVWWVSSQMRKERELCCDDMVVETCGDAIRYARALTTLERMRGGTPALALGSTGGVLSFRVKRLLAQPALERRAPSRLAALAAMTLGIVCFGLSMNWTRAKAQSDLLTVPASDPGIAIDANGAELIHRAPVVYPEALREKKIGGIVTVEATLDDRGMVSDARVVSGPPELRKAALASVLNWHFMPAGAGAIRDVTITFTSPVPQPVPTPAQMAQSREKSRTITSLFLQEQLAEAEKELDRVTAEPESARQPAELARTLAQVGQLRQQVAATEGNQQNLVRNFVRDEVSEAENQLARVQAEPASTRKPGKLEQMQRKVADLRQQLGLVQANELLLATRAEGEAGRANVFYFRPQSRGVAFVKTYEANASNPAVISRIEAGGLSDQVTKELLSRLPAHAGDLLTPERLDSIRKAAQQFDEHFNVAVEPAPAQGENVVVVRIDLRE